MSLDLEDLEQRGEGSPDDDREPTKRDRDYAAEYAKRKRRGAASQRGTKATALEVRLRESIEAVAGWIIERGDDELGEIIERDAGKMAGVAGKLAGSNPVAKRAVTVIADLLEPVRAFGPTLRVLYSRLVGWREDRLAAQELADELGDTDEVTPAVEVGAPPAPPEPEIAEPWRVAD